jgi:hypothetical protein
MPSINIAVPHNLSQDEARTRIQRLINENRAQLGNFVSDVQENWTGNTGTFGFRAMGFPISGRLHVEPSHVRVEINLPLAALPFKSKIESEMTTRAKALLT